jgi:hypothetical protein
LSHQTEASLIFSPPASHTTQPFSVSSVLYYYFLSLAIDRSHKSSIFSQTRHLSLTIVLIVPSNPFHWIAESVLTQSFTDRSLEIAIPNCRIKAHWTRIEAQWKESKLSLIENTKGVKFCFLYVFLLHGWLVKFGNLEGLNWISWDLISGLLRLFIIESIYVLCLINLKHSVANFVLWIV